MFFHVLGLSLSISCATLFLSDCIGRHSFRAYFTKILLTKAQPIISKGIVVNPSNVYHIFILSVYHISIISIISNVYLYLFKPKFSTHCRTHQLKKFIKRHLKAQCIALNQLRALRRVRLGVHMGGSRRSIRPWPRPFIHFGYGLWFPSKERKTNL